MTLCAMFGCNNNSAGKRCTTPGPHSFHKFPEDRKLRRLWIRATRQARYKPGKSAVVCGDHFDQKDLKVAKGKVCLHLNAVPKFVSVHPVDQAEPDGAVMSMPADVHMQSPLKLVRSPAKAACSQIDAEDLDRSFEGMELEDHAEVSHTASNASAYVTAEEVSFEELTDGYLDRIRFLESEVARLKKNNEELLCARLEAQFNPPRTTLVASRYQHKPDTFRRLTGVVTYDRFKEFLAVFEPAVLKSAYKRCAGREPRPDRRKLKLEEQFFFVLLRLRQGSTELLCGEVFDISEATVSRIFNMWINVMAVIIRRINFFPPIHRAFFGAPRGFIEAGYGRVRVIIDCFEVFCEVPSHTGTQSFSYSQYKKHTTIKFLVGVTPSVKISFISHGFLGSISDERAVEQSGLVRILDDGDRVMADKGFRLPLEAAARDIELIMPDFLGPVPQLSVEAANRTFNIARFRIHVERAICRVKEFRILQGKFW